MSELSFEVPSTVPGTLVIHSFVFTMHTVGVLVESNKKPRTENHSPSGSYGQPRAQLIDPRRKGMRVSSLSETSTDDKMYKYKYRWCPVPQCPASPSHPRPLRFCKSCSEQHHRGSPQPQENLQAFFLPHPTPGTWEGGD